VQLGKLSVALETNLHQATSNALAAHPRLVDGPAAQACGPGMQLGHAGWTEGRNPDRTWDDVTCAQDTDREGGVLGIRSSQQQWPCAERCRRLRVTAARRRTLLSAVTRTREFAAASMAKCARGQEAAGKVMRYSTCAVSTSTKSRVPPSTRAATRAAGVSLCN
jgi:hypothetical protein